MRKLIGILFILFHLSISVALAQSDSMIVSKMREHGMEFTHENSVKLLMSGYEKFDHLFEDIRQDNSYLCCTATCHTTGKQVCGHSEKRISTNVWLKLMYPF